VLIRVNPWQRNCGAHAQTPVAMDRRDRVRKL